MFPPDESSVGGGVTFPPSPESELELESLISAVGFVNKSSLAFLAFRVASNISFIFVAPKNFLCSFGITKLVKNVL